MTILSSKLSLYFQLNKAFFPNLEVLTIFIATFPCLYKGAINCNL